MCDYGCSCDGGLQRVSLARNQDADGRLTLPKLQGCVVCGSGLAF